MNFFRFIKEFFEKYSPSLKELHSKKDWFVSKRQLEVFLNSIDIENHIIDFEPIRIEFGPKDYPYFEVIVSGDFVNIKIKLMEDKIRGKRRIFGPVGFLYFPVLEMIKVCGEKTSRFGLDIFEACDEMEIDLESLDDTKIMELTLECPISSKINSLNCLL